MDFSFGIKGLSRFRGNIFVQRGAVAGAFRTIPYEILVFEKLVDIGICPFCTRGTGVRQRLPPLNSEGIMAELTLNRPLHSVPRGVGISGFD